MQETVIEVKKISKDYRIYKSNLQRVIAELLGRDKGVLKHALKEISFAVKRGESIAIFGNIGSGRSTLLKILAGITFPSGGDFEAKEEVTLVMNLRAGFERELTGRENIKARCIALGWSKEEIKAKEQWIIEFAEIEEVVDHQIKTYTTGMAGRLGFAISIARTPKIIIVDELIGVGGKRYKEKCLEQLEEISKESEVTMIYVPNTANIPIKLCERGIVLDEGEIKFDGPKEKAVAFFKENCFVARSQHEVNTIRDSDDDTVLEDIDV